jgi:hypothetical protein
MNLRFIAVLVVTFVFANKLAFGKTADQLRTAADADYCNGPVDPSNPRSIVGPGVPKGPAEERYLGSLQVTYNPRKGWF